MLEYRKYVFATLCAGCAAWVGACSGSAEPAGPDEACFRALDCQTGLVCVEGVCTNDISAIVPEGAGAPAEPTPEETTTGDAGAP